jgi:ribonucleoside-diphosphate reductase beta chain
VLAGYAHLLAAGRRAQWDDAGLDLTADVAAFAALPAPVRGRVAALVGGFVVAERAVAEHLVPFTGAAAGDPELAELLELQVADETRHARVFDRLAREVCGLEDPAAVAGPGLRRLFEYELPATAAALARGEAGLGEAVGLYHLVLEGLVLGMGQDALLELLEGAASSLRVTRDAVSRVQRDERWHVGLGVACLAAEGLEAPPADELVELALEAWGEEATEERVERARRLHGRRVREAGSLRVPSGG